MKEIDQVKGDRIEICKDREEMGSNTNTWAGFEMGIHFI